MDTAAPKYVGTLFLAAMFAAIAGNLLLLPIIGETDYLRAVLDKALTVRIAGLLMLLNSIFVAAIGVLMYPTLSQRSTFIALGYVVSRAIESVVLIFGIVSLMSLLYFAEQYAKDDVENPSYILTLGKSAIDSNWYSYNIAMIVLGVGSLTFCYVLYTAKLVPKTLSLLGFFGYFVLAATSTLAILGFEIGLLVTLPVFLFEVIFGVWLIAKGFSSTSLFT